MALEKAQEPFEHIFGFMENRRHRLQKQKSIRMQLSSRKEVPLERHIELKTQFD